MSARDELAELIATTKYKNLKPAWAERDALSPVKYFSLKQADAVIAAGYSKPRTITTAEELDALREGAVISGDWATYQRVLGSWVTFGGPGTVLPDLPATVLYEPRS